MTAPLVPSINHNPLTSTSSSQSIPRPSPTGSLSELHDPVLVDAAWRSPRGVELTDAIARVVHDVTRASVTAQIRASVGANLERGFKMLNLVAAERAKLDEGRAAREETHTQKVGQAQDGQQGGARVSAKGKEKEIPPDSGVSQKHADASTMSTGYALPRLTHQTARRLTDN